MILVTVGVHTMPFDRLLKAVDAVAAIDSLDRHELVVQHGASADLCEAGQRFAYCSGSELDELLDGADLVISLNGGRCSPVPTPTTCPGSLRSTQPSSCHSRRRARLSSVSGRNSEPLNTR